MKKRFKKLSALLLVAVMVISSFVVTAKGEQLAAAQAKFTRADMITRVVDMLGAKSETDAIKAVTDIKETHKAYKSYAAAIDAGIVSASVNNKLRPNSKASLSFCTSVLAKLQGVSTKKVSAALGGSTISKALIDNYIKKNFLIISKSQNFSSNYKATVNRTVVINAKNVNLGNCEIIGDLIIAEGAAGSTITLKNVSVTGRIIVRGKNTAVIMKSDSDAANVVFNASADKSELSVENGSEAGTVKINSEETVINGNGTINSIFVNANKAVIDIKAGKVTTKKGIEAPESSVVDIEDDKKVPEGAPEEDKSEATPTAPIIWIPSNPVVVPEVPTTTPEVPTATPTPEVPTATPTPTVPTTKQYPTIPTKNQNK